LPNLRRHVLKMCALLGSTYIYEQYFSRTKHVKSKTRTQITDQHLGNTLRIATSNIDANIDKLVKPTPTYTLKVEFVYFIRVLFKVSNAQRSL
jgi:hypothetical protein